MLLLIAKKARYAFRNDGFWGMCALGVAYLRSKAWKGVARLDGRIYGALSGRGGIHAKSFMLWPNSAKRIYLHNLKKGSYRLEIRHGDRWVAANRKSLVARFRFFSGKTSEEAARKMGLSLGDDQKSFSYCGGGWARGDFFAQHLTIDLPQDERWLRIDLEVMAHRLVILDNFSLQPIQSSLNYIQSAVTELVDQHSNLNEAQFLLYADIDVNVVDGSSVWLSSMASILCNVGKCILVVKSAPRSDIILSNVHHRENLIVVGPEELNLRSGRLSVAEACEVLRCLDAQLPKVRNVVVRGLDAALKIHDTRQFRERSLVYLTDFYVVAGGELSIPREVEEKIGVTLRQAATVLAQTPQIENRLRNVARGYLKTLLMPPPIPDTLPQVAVRSAHQGLVRIGYAGKISPDWGIDELLDWIDSFADNGRKVELHIAANKISNGSGGHLKKGYRELIIDKIKRSNAVHHTELNRDQAMKLMAEMDFVWCWRPAQLEDNTLEFSTKLVEMAASGARCICYPSEINKSALGEDYPFFAQSKEDFTQIIGRFDDPPTTLARKLQKKHGLSSITDHLRENALNIGTVSRSHRICVAGHDYKFIDGYLSHLKAAGHEVIRDQWEWGECTNLERSESIRDWAEIVFCEWGLANAVWHSNYAKPGKRVFIRAHLQEINERARKFGHLIKIENVEKVIFVSAKVRDRALELFKWPAEKTMVVPNFVLSDEYCLMEREFGETINLGMVGIIPQRKRLDRAVDTLLELRRRGRAAQLHIKGPRPEELEFMRAPSRKAELDYYQGVYDKIAGDALIRGNVHFYPWGNDVALWYQKVEHILSCSDFESFHYALADGVLTGCQPLIWPWEEADLLYSPDWLVADAREAADKVEAFRMKSDRSKSFQIESNRSLIVQRYGYEHIFKQLNEAIGI